MPQASDRRPPNAAEAAKGDRPTEETRGEFVLLLLEDSTLDAELVQAHLSRAGVRFRLERVDTREEFAAALAARSYDLILADHALPAFDGLAALSMVRAAHPDLPFIFVSGKMGEQVAIDSLKRGAADYVLKDHLDRLGPAVVRALAEAAERRERRRADEARRMSEFRFGRLVEQSPQSTQIFSPDGTCVQVNRAWERLWGVTLADYPGYNILNDPQLAERGILPLLRRAFAGEAVTIEPIPYTPDRGQYAGQIRWCGANVYPVTNDSGQVEQVVLVHNDVTERREAEDRLEQQTRLFDAVLSSVRDYFFLYDPDGRFLYANRVLLDLWGLPADQALGRTMRELGVAPEVESHMLADIRRVIDSREPVAGQVAYSSPTGTTGHFEYILAPVFGTDGRVERVAGTSRDVTARLREQRDLQAAKEAAEASAGRWRAVVGSMVEGVVVADGSGNLLEWNRAALAMHGHQTLEEVQQHLNEFPRIYELVTGDGRLLPLTEWPMSRVLRGETFAECEVTVRRLDKELTRIISYSGSPVFDRAGNVALAVLTLHDMTDERAAQGAVRESEARFRAVLEQSLDAAYRRDLRTDKYDYLSPVVREVMGLDPQRMRAMSLDEYLAHIHPEDREHVRGGIGEGARSGRGRVEYRLRGDDGQYRWLADHFTVQAGADGRPIYRSGIVRDVSDRKRIEQEREQLLVGERAARAEAETLSRVGQTLAAELDLHRLVQAATDAATELAGAAFGAFFYSVPDPQGGHLTLYTIAGVPKEEFARFPTPRATEVFGPTLRGEATVRSDDITADPRYGRNAPYHGMPKGHLPVRSYLAVPVRSRSGEVLGAMFIGHPEPARFSERHERLVGGVMAHAAVAVDNARLYDRERAARAEAERQSRMKDEFLATLSHELRTPLNAILGWAQVLRDDVAAPGAARADEVREGLDVIERNARAQTRIIEDLLEMSRIISGKVRLDVQRVELAPVVEAAIQTVRHAAEAKGVRLQVLLDPLAGPVSGDPARLQQVFWNLLSNSVKHSTRGGRIQVLLERVNSHVEVSVIDEGEGIDPAFLPHVFDRFRQADSSTTRRHGGLGLGLSIVKQLVELHGGSVRAKSPGPGRGATFTIALPLVPIHPDPFAGTDETRRHPRAGVNEHAEYDACLKLNGLRVLVVDDEPDARALVRRLLEDCEAVVTSAASAAEAIAAIKAGPVPDVLVSDIGMPDEDGYSLIRKVRALPAGQGGDVPALALTAYARSEDRTRALLAGFQSHVAKPVEPAELVATIAALHRIR